MNPEQVFLAVIVIISATLLISQMLRQARYNRATRRRILDYPDSTTTRLRKP